MVVFMLRLVDLYFTEVALRHENQQAQNRRKITKNEVFSSWILRREGSGD